MNPLKECFNNYVSNCITNKNPNHITNNEPNLSVWVIPAVVVVLLLSFVCVMRWPLVATLIKKIKLKEWRLIDVCYVQVKVRTTRISYTFRILHINRIHRISLIIHGQYFRRINSSKTM